MSADRSATLSPRQQALKREAKGLVEAVGGVEAAAGYCRAGKSQLSDYGNRNVASFMPADVILDLEALTEPLVTRLLARSAGFALVRLPSPDLADTIWSQRAAKLLKEGGDIVAGLGAALESGNEVEPAEAKDLLADAHELVAIAVEIEAALKRRAEGMF